MELKSENFLLIENDKNEIWIGDTKFKTDSSSKPKGIIGHLPARDTSHARLDHTCVRERVNLTPIPGWQEPFTSRNYRFRPVLF